MSKKSLILVVSLVLALTVGLGGTLAFLTDRDAETNIFTVGNVDIDLTEDFEQGAELIPGVDVEKKPVITNEGTTDAWVWMTWSIPADLDMVGTAYNNLLHWNFLGATADAYVSQTYVDKAIAEGHLPEGTTAEDLKAANTLWNVDDKVAMTTETIDGIEYHKYTLLYNKALQPGEVTVPSIVKVYLDDHLDIDPDGYFFHVEKGVVTKTDYNVKKNGNPKIYVAAYGIQAEGFDTVKDAYDAYMGQWGDLGAAEYTPVVNASNSEELAAAVEAAAGESTIIKLPAGEFKTNFEIAAGSDITIVGNGEDTVLSGQIASTTSTAGTLTLSNLTYKVDDTILDSTGISQTGKSAIALWGNQKVVCTNVTFEMSLKDSTAITAWWDTNEGTSITVKGCTFNCNGQRPIRATGNVTVEDTTFNDPYRYAVQLTAKASTAVEMDKAIINFNNNTIINGENGKAFVYGIQLEGAEYGCNDCVINGTGNTIENGGSDSTMYYCECGKVVHETIEWNVEATPVHEG